MAQSTWDCTATLPMGSISYSANREFDLARASWISTTRPYARVLINTTDDLPSYSPDGERIISTREVSATDLKVCTIRPDESDLRVLTMSGANETHAAWTADDRSLYSSGDYGFRDEVAKLVSMRHPRHTAKS